MTTYSNHYSPVLFMIDPSTIDFSALPAIPLQDCKLLPDAPGIYIAVDENYQALYIGKAKSLFVRWRNHPFFQCLAETGNTLICYLEMDEASIHQAESYLIWRHRPRFNKNGNPDWQFQVTPSNWMAKARQDAGITQDALAQALGVTGATIRNWEKGRSDPALNIYQCITLFEMIPNIAEYALAALSEAA